MMISWDFDIIFPCYICPLVTPHRQWSRRTSYFPSLTRNSANNSAVIFGWLIGN